VETALQKMGEERGERWLESHVREKVDSAFGRENTLAGFAGLVRFCEVYRSITDDLFAGLQMAKLLRASPILFEFDLLRAKCIGGQCAFAVGWR
jgi:hypothetical protein